MRTRKSSSDRKAEIVETTLALVAEHGPERVTTQAVATRVGITQAGVFRHFPAKRDLWLAVAAWVVGEAQRRWEVAGRLNESPLASIKAVVIAQMEFIQDTPAVSSLIFSRELHAQNEELRQAFLGMADRFYALLTGLAKCSQDSGELSDVIKPEDIASLLLTFTPGLATRWSLGGRSFNLPRRGERLLDIMLTCLPKANRQSREGDHAQA